MKRNNIYSKRVAALLKVAIGVCFGTNSTFRATNEIAEAPAADAAPQGRRGRGGAVGSQARSVPEDYISRLIDAQLSLNEMWIFTIF